MRLARSVPPNLSCRYCARSMPAVGMSGLSSNGRQPICTSRPGRCASARSSRRLPMKHHGQMVSETMSISMTAALGAFPDPRIGRSEQRFHKFGRAVNQDGLDPGAAETVDRCLDHNLAAARQALELAAASLGHEVVLDAVADA